LAKYVAYMLERRPDEFGLVPDPQGFVKTKEFLKALHEEPGFKAVRQGDLEEIRISVPAPPLELDGDRIRGRDRQRLPARRPPQTLPRLLYTCVRRRAYPHVHEKGIRPMGREHIVLAADPEMALRLGRRLDPQPVLLTVMSDLARQKSITFFEGGENLFLAPSIPVDCFSGPPLPKESEPRKPKPKAPPSAPVAAGSFAMDPDHFAHAVSGRRNSAPNLPGVTGAPGRKGKKRDRKRKRERPPWRQ
jgi:putative RNA 2'-phosphotransferase